MLQFSGAPFSETLAQMRHVRLG